jgi:ankyrin repeat protein
MASASASRAVVKLLIDHGANVNAANGAALVAAVRRKDKEMVQMLVNAGANLAGNHEAYQAATWVPGMPRFLVQLGYPDIDGVQMAQNQVAAVCGTACELVSNLMQSFRS